MSNNFLVRHIMKAGGSFFVGALIALGTLCPKVLAQSTRQLIVEWGSQKTNNSQTFLWFYNDGTYTAQVQTTTGPISVETNQSITVNGRYSITGNTIRFDLVDSSILDSVTALREVKSQKSKVKSTKKVQAPKFIYGK